MSATGAAVVAQTIPPAKPQTNSSGDEMIFVQLAREIAMDIHPLTDILKNHEIDTVRWEAIKLNARFQALLLAQVEEWNSALNTGERVKLKALACIEEAMPEFYARMHDRQENLPAKVKALEVFTQIAGITKNGQGAAIGGGEKFSVTINLGADKQLTITAPSPSAIGVGDV